MRVLIADDSSFMRKSLGHLLEADPALEVAGTAANGIEALRLVKELRPDVVLMDVQMPGMDGLEALARIMDECPVPVVVISGLGPRNGANAIKALELGAVDFIAKPSGPISYDIDKIRAELVGKVKAAASARVNRLDLPGPFRLSGAATALRDTLVVIGGSTGAARALGGVLPLFPQRLPSAVLVVLHLAPDFLAPLAQRLAWDCSLPVEPAQTEMTLGPGKIILAGEGTPVLVDSTLAEKRLVMGTWMEPAPPDQVIDRVMESAADAFGPGTIGVLLTGMGTDGVKGLQAIKEAGGRTLVQDPATCLVTGMPAAAIAAGLADQVVPLDRLAETILSLVISH